MAIPERILNLFKNGEVATPEHVTEIKAYLKANKPMMLMLLTDKVIAQYNANTVDGRKQMGQLVLKYFS